MNLTPFYYGSGHSSKVKTSSVAGVCPDSQLLHGGDMFCVKMVLLMDLGPSTYAGAHSNNLIFVLPVNFNIFVILALLFILGLKVYMCLLSDFMIRVQQTNFKV